MHAAAQDRVRRQQDLELADAAAMAAQQLPDQPGYGALPGRARQARQLPRALRQQACEHRFPLLKPNARTGAVARKKRALSPSR